MAFWSRDWKRTSRSCRRSYVPGWWKQFQSDLIASSIANGNITSKICDIPSICCCLGVRAPDNEMECTPGPSCCCNCSRIQSNAEPSSSVLRPSTEERESVEFTVMSQSQVRGVAVSGCVRETRYRLLGDTGSNASDWRAQRLEYGFAQFEKVRTHDLTHSTGRGVYQWLVALVSPCASPSEVVRTRKPCLVSHPYFSPERRYNGYHPDPCIL